MSGDRLAYTRDFIECYKNNPVLWDRSHPNYSSFVMKEIAYNRLLEIWESYNGSGSFDDVKKMMNNLRGRYRKELRKISLAEDAGKVYMPGTRLFKMLEFLHDNIKVEREVPSEKEKAFVQGLPSVSELRQSDIDQYTPELRVRDSLISRCAFPKEFITEFIVCLGEHPCLWKSDHSTYRCDITRKIAYAELLKILQKFCGEECTLYDVKRKINSIRTSYAREKRKKIRNPSYEPKIWWLPLAKFLDSRIPRRKTRNSTKDDEESMQSMSYQDEMSSTEMKSEEMDEIEIDPNISFENDKEELIELTADPFEEEENEFPHCQRKCKSINLSDENTIMSESVFVTDPDRCKISTERKRICISAEDKLLLSAYENLQKKDALDDMSKIWGDKLRLMTDIQRLYATKAINEIIFQGELEHLTFEVVQKISALSLGSNEKDEA